MSRLLNVSLIRTDDLKLWTSSLSLPAQTLA